MHKSWIHKRCVTENLKSLSAWTWTSMKYIVLSRSIMQFKSFLEGVQCLCHKALKGVSLYPHRTYSECGHCTKSATLPYTVMMYTKCFHNRQVRINNELSKWLTRRFLGSHESGFLTKVLRKGVNWLLYIIILSLLSYLRIVLSLQCSQVQS